MTFMEIKHLKKVYTTKLGSKGTEALKDVNFSVEKGGVYFGDGRIRIW